MLCMKEPRGVANGIRTVTGLCSSGHNVVNIIRPITEILLSLYFQYSGTFQAV